MVILHSFIQSSLTKLFFSACGRGGENQVNSQSTEEPDSYNNLSTPSSYLLSTDVGAPLSTALSSTIDGTVDSACDVICRAHVCLLAELRRCSCGSKTGKKREGAIDVRGGLIH